ncbi:periplasmic heavy metal sensor [Novosphingobium umbonatum]|uniref:Periplasmic heavy metal sensor n=1 Tax=Novosphingobium umbonatum TaxID=1908524 RepID=A0A437N3T2_9SPHN|nr:periplasmic heavy metal sensor [Novosphingobium umbonatum]RVU04586.1 periplasmic heavy metal sensor [Novosphingobium umbonatum]
MAWRKTLVFAIVAFAFGMIGALVGQTLIRSGTPESELHDLLHHQLNLDAKQQAQIDVIEQRFAVRRRALELELRADNAHLADAIQAEHGYGPRVSDAIDRSHVAMGQMQKETLEHIFAMRSVLTTEQSAKFDKEIVNALTGKDR